MRPGKGAQASLKDILNGVLQRAGLERRVRQGQIMLAWKELVGPANARHSWPLRIKDDILLVGCSSHAWAQTLTMLRGQIMDKVSRQLGEGLLREIHFYGVGQMPAEEKEKNRESQTPAQIKLRVEEMQWLKEAVKEISEPLLQEKAKAALGSLLRQRKWHEQQGEKPCSGCGRLHSNKGGFCISCLRAPKGETRNHGKN